MPRQSEATKYLSYAGLRINAGISHQGSNFTAMIKEAALSGRTLIMPKFRLTGKHNLGRNILTQMDEYDDLLGIRVNGQPVSVLTQCAERAPSGWTVLPPNQSLIGCAVPNHVRLCSLRRVLRLLYSSVTDAISCRKMPAFAQRLSSTVLVE